VRLKVPHSLYIISLVLAAAGCPAALAQVAPARDTAPPLTAAGRLEWFARSTAGPASLMGGVVSAGWGTLFNAPQEYGPHWEGFGKRYGVRMSTVSTGNALEASLGAIRGEDPRYEPAAGLPFGRRVGNIFRLTVLARDGRGQVGPAYARYAALAGGSFLSNAWRADSDATAGHATVRIATGLLTRLAGNAFAEFWPDLKGRFFKRNRPPRP
jgi:hypothetical protein